MGGYIKDGEQKGIRSQPKRSFLQTTLSESFPLRKSLEAIPKMDCGHVSEDQHRVMRMITFCAVVVSTVAVCCSVIILPMTYQYIQSLQSHMSQEVHFCKSRSREMNSQLIDIHHEESIDGNARLTRSSWLFGQQFTGQNAYGTPPVVNPVMGGSCCTCEQGGAGPVGEPGEDGEEGEDGFLGEEGYPGNDGKVVEMTKEVEVCMKCPTGPPGGRGPPGSKGRGGPRGDSGAPGSPGRSGGDGPPGDLGTPGTDGKPGQKGGSGPDGQVIPLDGAPPGPPGPDGPAGPQGPEGPVGKDGRPGTFGPLGPIGSRGKPGKNGNDGFPGGPGDDGNDGTEGDCAFCPSPRTSPGY